ncbi:2-dehydro-3-deoxyphosphooctonate aldolase [Rhodocytophaga rosea]|uniref:2-dehydro-3-deoxyphosphooctonate aldolase n=1 Tax=Rhodocytophaga rosea TaxID=2704465 RepID=A0A6C0GW54_9BACT|nr:2-dehydro-3-deoxyphosphooctonate aldolase [Rhodocytophaga rosea]
MTESANDKTYGYEKGNPVKVGGSKENSGPKNQRRFLNGLLGPNGEQIKYYRAGSCCGFKTPNGLFDNIGLLDLYKVYWDGSDTLNIYINLYDKGDLMIPVGLTAKQK